MFGEISSSFFELSDLMTVSFGSSLAFLFGEGDSTLVARCRFTGEAILLGGDSFLVTVGLRCRTLAGELTLVGNSFFVTGELLTMALIGEATFAGGSFFGAGELLATTLTGEATLLGSEGGGATGSSSSNSPKYFFGLIFRPERDIGSELVESSMSLDETACLGVLEDLSGDNAIIDLPRFEGVLAGALSWTGVLVTSGAANDFPRLGVLTGISSAFSSSGSTAAFLFCNTGPTRGGSGASP